MTEQITEEMQEAVDLSPELHTARFQLGLLYLTQAIPEAALNTLEPLMNLGEESYLAHFAKGLIHLMRDEFESCTRALQQGIALNRDNLALNADMQKILFAISQHQAAEEPSAQTQTQNRVESEDKKAATSLWLSAYQQEDNEH